MARITVEDCLQKIPNRFQLVLAATYRARMLSQGHAPKIETKNKPGVTALRLVETVTEFAPPRPTRRARPFGHGAGFPILARPPTGVHR